METLDPNVAGTLALTSGVAFAMVWVGARMRMLELRSGVRRCPSCGLLLKRRKPCRCAA